MALIEIDGLPSYKNGWIFYGEVLIYQRVQSSYMIYCMQYKADNTYNDVYNYITLWYVYINYVTIYIYITNRYVALQGMCLKFVKSELVQASSPLNFDPRRSLSCWCRGHSLRWQVSIGIPYHELGKGYLWEMMNWDL